MHFLNSETLRYYFYSNMMWWFYSSGSKSNWIINQCEFDTLAILCHILLLFYVISFNHSGSHFNELPTILANQLFTVPALFNTSKW